MDKLVRLLVDSLLLILLLGLLGLPISAFGLSGYKTPTGAGNDTILGVGVQTVQESTYNEDALRYYIIIGGDVTEQGAQSTNPVNTDL